MEGLPDGVVVLGHERIAREVARLRVAMKPATMDDLHIAQARLLDRIQSGDLTDEKLSLSVLRGHVIGLEIDRRRAGGKTVNAEDTIRPLRRMLAVDIVEDLTRLRPRGEKAVPARRSNPAVRHRDPVMTEAFWITAFLVGVAVVLAFFIAASG